MFSDEFISFSDFTGIDFRYLPMSAMDTCKFKIFYRILLITEKFIINIVKV